eukprot:365773-Chlamydomonas_euryale.AAC.8
MREPVGARATGGHRAGGHVRLVGVEVHPPVSRRHRSHARDVGQRQQHGHQQLGLYAHQRPRLVTAPSPQPCALHACMRMGSRRMRTLDAMHCAMRCQRLHGRHSSSSSSSTSKSSSSSSGGGSSSSCSSDGRGALLPPTPLPTSVAARWCVCACVPARLRRVAFSRTARACPAPQWAPLPPAPPP